MEKTELPLDVSRAIRQAIVHEMGLFLSRPVSHLLVPVEGTTRAEWIVTDADHVNGLLHRLREHKAFEARPHPPTPRRLREVTEHLVSVAIENYPQVNWCWREDSNLSASHVPVLDLSTWDVNRHRFIDWMDDRDLREQVGRLFELCQTYARFWPIAVQTVNARTGAPDWVQVTMDRTVAVVGGPTLRSLRQTRDEIMRLVLGIVEKVGTQEHKDALLVAHRAYAER